MEAEKFWLPDEMKRIADMPVSEIGTWKNYARALLDLAQSSWAEGASLHQLCDPGVDPALMKLCEGSIREILWELVGLGSQDDPFHVMDVAASSSIDVDGFAQVRADYYKKGLASGWIVGARLRMPYSHDKGRPLYGDIRDVSFEAVWQVLDEQGGEWAWIGHRTCAATEPLVTRLTELEEERLPIAVGFNSCYCFPTENLRDLGLKFGLDAQLAEKIACVAHDFMGQYDPSPLLAGGENVNAIALVAKRVLDALLVKMAEEATAGRMKGRVFHTVEPPLNRRFSDVENSMGIILRRQD